MPQVSVVLGSKNDFINIVDPSAMPRVFEAVGIEAQYTVCSVHRNHGELSDVCGQLMKDGVQVFIGIAGMSAGLPGGISAAILGERPVLGVPLANAEVPSGLDSAYAMLTLPPGTAVLTAGIAYNDVTLKNTAIAAAQIIALSDEGVRHSLRDYLRQEREKKPVIYNLEEAS